MIAEVLYYRGGLKKESRKYGLDGGNTLLLIKLKLACI
jgi:hypothetical protein